MDYLGHEMNSISQQIDEINKVIKDQMELTQSFWSSVLAFVLAIYVPVSFASVSH